MLFMIGPQEEATRGIMKNSSWSFKGTNSLDFETRLLSLPLLFCTHPNGEIYYFAFQQLWNPIELEATNKLHKQVSRRLSRHIPSGSKQQFLHF